MVRQTWARRRRRQLRLLRLAIWTGIAVAALLVVAHIPFSLPWFQRLAQEKLSELVVQKVGYSKVQWIPATGLVISHVWVGDGWEVAHLRSREVRIRYRPWDLLRQKQVREIQLIEPEIIWPGSGEHLLDLKPQPNHEDVTGASLSLPIQRFSIEQAKIVGPPGADGQPLFTFTDAWLQVTTPHGKQVDLASQALLRQPDRTVRVSMEGHLDLLRRAADLTGQLECPQSGRTGLPFGPWEFQCQAIPWAMQVDWGAEVWQAKLQSQPAGADLRFTWQGRTVVHPLRNVELNLAWDAKQRRLDLTSGTMNVEDVDWALAGKITAATSPRWEFEAKADGIPGQAMQTIVQSVPKPPPLTLAEGTVNLDTVLRGTLPQTGVPEFMVKAQFNAVSCALSALQTTVENIHGRAEVHNRAIDIDVQGMRDNASFHTHGRIWGEPYFWSSPLAEFNFTGEAPVPSLYQQFIRWWPVLTDHWEVAGSAVGDVTVSWPFDDFKQLELTGSGYIRDATIFGPALPEPLTKVNGIVYFAPPYRGVKQLSWQTSLGETQAEGEFSADDFRLQLTGPVQFGAVRPVLNALHPRILQGWQVGGNLDTDVTIVGIIKPAFYLQMKGKVLAAEGSVAGHLLPQPLEDIQGRFDLDGTSVRAQNASLAVDGNTLQLSGSVAEATSWGLWRKYEGEVQGSLPVPELLAWFPASATPSWRSWLSGGQLEGKASFSGQLPPQRKGQWQASAQLHDLRVAPPGPLGPIEISNAALEAAPDHLSAEQVEWRWQDITGQAHGGLDRQGFEINLGYTGGLAPALTAVRRVLPTFMSDYEVAGPGAVRVGWTGQWGRKISEPSGEVEFDGASLHAQRLKEPLTGLKGRLGFEGAKIHTAKPVDFALSFLSGKVNLDWDAARQPQTRFELQTDAMPLERISDLFAKTAEVPPSAGGWEAEGTIKSATVHFLKFDAEQATSKLHITGGGGNTIWKITDFNSRLWGGVLSGGATLKTTPQQLTYEIALHGGDNSFARAVTAFAPQSKGKVTGQLLFDMNLAGEGKDWNTLAGSGTIEVDRAEFRNVGFLMTLASAGNFSGFNEVQFDTVTFPFQLHDQRFYTDDGRFSSPSLHLFWKGSVGLDATVDAHLKVNAIPRMFGLRELPGVKNILRAAGSITEQALAFHVTGALGGLKYEMVPTEILGNLLHGALEAPARLISEETPKPTQ